MNKHFKMVCSRLVKLATAMAVAVTIAPVHGAGSQVVDENNHVFYEPQQQGVYSNGGYTIEKISHPELGTGMIDGILEGEDQDRGNSYSWSMAESGDYVYIGTCYNSTYYIYQNAVQTKVQGMKDSGVLSSDIDAAKLADEIVSFAFGADTFDKTLMSNWKPVIISVNKYTGESKVIFCERDEWANYPDIFPGYSPLMPVKNYLSGYRMAFEFKGKIYFAGMGNPTATLVEVDPTTNECDIVYYNINKTRGVANGVHGLLVFDDEILMCYATDNYDGKGTPGGRIVASSDPSASLDSWRVIADQDDFDNLPAVMQIDGLNGGGIWDIIDYNGALYVTIVTDKTDVATGITNKQGFAMYKGTKNADGSFNWSQVIGGDAPYTYGLGINYSMSCNLWTYNGYLYLGTYNDPMLDLNAVFATGSFKDLYNDLAHSIYLYRMDANGNFEQVGGTADNPYFPNGPIGNLGPGLGSNSNQYVWRFGEHNGELYLGTYDTSTLTYLFTQLTDGQVEALTPEDVQQRKELLGNALLEVLGKSDDQYLNWLLKDSQLSTAISKLYQKLSGVATDLSGTKNPVPVYFEALKEYEQYKENVYKLLDAKLYTEEFSEEVVLETEPEMIEQIVIDEEGEVAPANNARIRIDQIVNTIVAARKQAKESADRFFNALDQIFYNKDLENFMYYYGVNYYAKQCEKGFDLLVSNDGVHFDALTRNGFGDYSNHGLRTICSTEVGVFAGTANPYFGTQLWLIHSDRDLDRADGPIIPVEPEEPVTPEEPEEPVTPVDPEEPVTPVEPEEPVTPVEPEEPVTPVDPEEPVTPVDPEEPVTPVEPVEPEEPVTPEEPENPETPVTPEDPVTPENPGEEGNEQPTTPEQGGTTGGTTTGGTTEGNTTPTKPGTTPNVGIYNHAAYLTLAGLALGAVYIEFKKRK